MMSQIADDVVPDAPAVHSVRMPVRTLRFVFAYIAAFAVLLALSPVNYSISPWLGFMVLGSFFVSCEATLAMVPGLVVLASRRCLPALLLLIAAHFMIGGIVFAVLREVSPHEAEILFRRGILYSALVTAAFSAMLAFGIRRRHWRIMRAFDEDESEIKRLQVRTVPIVAMDYALLLVCIPLIWLLKKGAGDWPLALPICLGIVIFTLGFVWFAMRKARRGFSPAIALTTALGLLYVSAFIGGFFRREIGYAILAFAYSPLTLWVGLLLSLRGDGYRWVRDFSVIADKDPIAEPDPLA